VPTSRLPYAYYRRSRRGSAIYRRSNATEAIVRPPRRRPLAGALEAALAADRARVERGQAFAGRSRPRRARR
jgi:hypothetical protein